MMRNTRTDSHAISHRRSVSAPSGRRRFRGRVLVSLLMGMLVACENEPAAQPSVDGEEVTEPAAELEKETPAELTPCQEHYGDACGIACNEEMSCPLGLFCSDGSCEANCFSDADCAEGVCTEQGHCHFESRIQLDPRITDPQQQKKEEEEPPTCVEGQVEFEAVMPQVWLLLDRSGSMDSFMDDVTRWEALGTVLLGAPEDVEDQGVVGDFEDRVAFGATFYTSGSGPTGCALNLESVALALNSYNSIRQRYNKLMPSGGTPTADSVAAVVARASSVDLTGGPKILVLATDGQPGGCRAREGDAESAVEQEVAQGFAKGIQTFAVRISTGTAAAHMQRIANLGVGLEPDADPPAPFFTAESQSELKSAFSTIIEEVPRSCVFGLNGDVDREEAGEGTVSLAGQELTYNDPDGWTLKQANQVELRGQACEDIQAGEEDLDINFPCEVFTPRDIH